MTSNSKTEHAAILRAASFYIDRLGWAVLPCHGKAPAVPAKAGGQGWLSATRDFAEFERAFRSFGADSIGVACKTSGFFAIDCDPRDGGDGVLQGLQKAGGELPVTVRAPQWRRRLSHAFL